MTAEREEQHESGDTKQPRVGMQEYKASLPRKRDDFKQYSDFAVIVRDFSTRFELLNIYLLLSGKGELAAAHRAVQWEKRPQSFCILGRSCLEAAGVRKTMESNVTLSWM